MKSDANFSHSPSLLTLTEGVEFTDDRSQHEDFRQLVDEVDGHTAGTDKNICNCEVYQIQIDRSTKRSIKGDSNNNTNVSNESHEDYHHCQDDFDVFNMTEWLED